MDSLCPTPVFVSDWSKKIPLCQVIWQYMGDSDTFVDMPREYSAKYEEHYRENTLHFEYDIWYAWGTKSYHYKVYLLNMTQENMNRNTVRQLRRQVVCNA